MLTATSPAGERVDEMMRADSRLSQLSKPNQEENETKAQYAWRLIRMCVAEAIESTEKSQMKDVVINHGIQFLRSLNHIQPIEDLVYNSVTGEYLTVDNNVIRVYLGDGRKKDIINPVEKITKLIHISSPLDLYLGWNFGSTEIFVMDNRFNITSMSEATGPVHAISYNAGINEIVTVGPGFLTSWVFRYGGRYMLPRKTTKDTLTENDDFQFLALEDTASRSQKAFAAYERHIVVFNLFEGTVSGFRRNLHARNITAMLFFNPLKYLVTGSEDGTIKVWDDKWHLQLVFVGHEGVINSLVVYPYGPMIMSASEDCTIRVWSLETCDEVDKVTTSEPAKFLVTSVNNDYWCSLAKTHVDLWKVQHMYALHSTIRYKVTSMKCTDHPQFQQRVVGLCQDASVRILSPVTGDIITSLIGNPRNKLQDAAYAIAEENLFAVYEDGLMVKSDTSTNPCKVVAKWPCPDKRKTCNYLLVYEYVITSDINEDTWGGIKRAVTTKGIAGTKRTAITAGGGNNRTLLLGGRKDGRLCVYDWDTGKVDFEIEGHGSKGVLSMVANSKYDQLISSGSDNIIKVWRLYPYCREALAPLMSFYCAHTPIHMSVMKQRLAVAFQDHSIASYTVVMYDLKGDKNRLDHDPEEDHSNSIVGFSSCAKMKLLASCSADGTLRVWSENNKLLRLLKLNATPSSMTFCSDKGDLMLGIGTSVYKINFKNYIPNPYRYKMAAMSFRHQKGERALPFDEKLVDAMSSDEVKRLKAAKSSFKFTHFMDILTGEENEEVNREKNEKQNAFNRIEDRESELTKLINGEISAKRKPRRSKAIKRRAFNEYLKMFYDQPKVTHVVHDPYDLDAADEKVHGKKVPDKAEYFGEVGPMGFFPDPKTARKSTDFDDEFDGDLPVRPDGFIPNSVLLRLLWPQQILEASKEPYVPPQLTREQLDGFNRISSLPLPHPSKVTLHSDYDDRALILDYDDEETKEDEDKESDSGFTLGKRPKKKEKEPEGPSAFMEKMRSAMVKSERTPSPKQEEAPAPPPEPISLEEKLSKPILKIVAKQSPTKLYVAQPLSPKPPPTKKAPSPPPRPATPLPPYIAQLIGRQWFDKYFPNCSESTLPKPWTMANFVSMLLRAMNIADYSYKVEILLSIKDLHVKYGIPNGNMVQQALLNILGDPKNPPSCVNIHQKKFIVEALLLVQTLGIYGRDFYTELLAQFLEADKEVRKVVMDIFTSCGLRDPYRYLPRELDQWDIWNVDDDNRTLQLRNMCRQWLEKWMTAFKTHLEATIDKLKKGHTLQGHLATSRSKEPKPKGILKKPAVNAIKEGEEDDVSKYDGVQFVPADQKVAVKFESSADPAAVDNATYMDAINYFCEMEFERETEKLRGTTVPAKIEEASTPEGEKNTVLVLPKIQGRSSLVRLGETHTSKCRPPRDTGLVFDLRLPPIITKRRGEENGVYIPPSINFPLTTVYMNPFPSPLDEIELMNCQPLLITLKSSQKYFLPSRSIVQDAK